MTEPTSRIRRWRQIPVWVFMALPVACSPVFLYLTLYSRISPHQRLEMERRWVMLPLKEKFWPEEGAGVTPGDPLVKIALDYLDIPEGARGRSSWITPDGMVHSTVHYGVDKWDEEQPASTAGLSQLPTLLRNLPPSDPLAGRTGRLLVAFQNKGLWVVRVYNRKRTPKAVEDLARIAGIWK